MPKPKRAVIGLANLEDFLNHEGDHSSEQPAPKIEDEEVDLGSHEDVQTLLSKAKISKVGFCTKDVSLDPATITAKRLLGKGGQGSVWQVFNPVTNCNYAIKFWTKKGRHGREDYQEELNLLTMKNKLRSPRIADFVGVFEAPDKGVYLAFEFCSGGDLHTLINKFYLEKKLIPEGFIWHVLDQLSEAVAVLHGALGPNPYVNENDPNPHVWFNSDEFTWHNDIKPENILLQWRTGADQQKYPLIKLGDFGHAQFFQTSQTTGLYATALQGHFRGTTCFAPPEQMDPILITAKTDIWGVGVVIHCLGHHNMPPIRFEGSDESQSHPTDTKDGPRKKRKLSGPKEPREAIAMILNDRRTPRDPKVLPPAYSEALNTIMMSCLDFDLMRRPTAAGLFRAARQQGFPRRDLMYRELPDWFYGSNEAASVREMYRHPSVSRPSARSGKGEIRIKSPQGVSYIQGKPDIINLTSD